MSEPLPGRTQTNQRAELLAVIRVLEIEPRPLHIKTDSQYVLDGCRQHRFVWAAAGWRKVGNADLWKWLHALLEARPGHFAISKVKGHATAQDLHRGFVKPEDKHGNDAADTLARAGAAQHSLPDDVVQNTKHCHAVTENVQRMMVAILVARSAVSAHACESESAHSSDSVGPDATSSSSAGSSSSSSESDSSGIASEADSRDMQAQVPLHTGSNHPT